MIDTTLTLDGKVDKRELTKIGADIFNIDGSTLIDGAILLDLSGQRIRLMKSDEQ